ncbi:hypothetical protein PUN4_990021 [Paraburkholderia unamae]|nr:hypothetical protein PUN4_990021 [Paraburkholderia unamae]
MRLAGELYGNQSHPYNHEHKHSGLKFVTPAQRHNGVANAVLGSVYIR